MKRIIGKWLGAIIAICIGVAWVWHLWIDNQSHKAKRQASASMEDRKKVERFNRWAYVAKEKEIAPGETIKMVVIPSQDGIDIFDTKCLIYTNTQLHTSSMICPDANREDIQEGIE